MQETAGQWSVMLAQGQNHYRLDSLWRKQQPTYHKLTSSVLIGPCWTHAPPLSLSLIDIFFKTSAPVMQAKNSRYILTRDTRIKVTPQPLWCYHTMCLKTILANIISCAAVERKFAFTIDKYLYPVINLHLDDGTSIMFKKCSGGIYYYETTKM